MRIRIHRTHACIPLQQLASLRQFVGAVELRAPKQHLYEICLVWMLRQERTNRCVVELDWRKRRCWPLNRTQCKTLGTRRTNGIGPRLRNGGKSLRVTCRKHRLSGCVSRSKLECKFAQRRSWIKPPRAHFFASPRKESCEKLSARDRERATQRFVFSDPLGV